jgi:hypothetical protein
MTSSGEGDVGEGGDQFVVAEWADVPHCHVAVSVEDDRRRQLRDFELLGERSIGVDELFVADAELVEEGDRLAWLKPLVDADEADAWILATRSLEFGKLGPARHAPGRPQIEDGRPVDLLDVELTGLLREVGECREDDVGK